MCHSGVMHKVNALQMRQNMGAVIRELQKTGEPCLLEKGRVPVAVLISLADYKKRFVDIEADLARRQIIDEIKSAQIKLPKGISSLNLIQELRAGK